MGFDPTGAAGIIDEYEGDELAINELLEDIEERVSRGKLADMLRTSSAVRAGGAIGAEGQQAYMTWRRGVLKDMEPRPQRTVFDRIGRAEKKAPKTVWDNFGRG